MDASDLTKADRSLDRRSDESFAATTGSGSSRSLDLSQEFLDAVSAQGVLPQQYWPQQASRYKRVGCEGQHANTAQCSRSPALNPPAPMGSTSTRCGGCGFCSGCCSSSGLLTGRASAAGPFDSAQAGSQSAEADGHFLPPVQGQRKRGCGVGPEYTPAQQQAQQHDQRQHRAQDFQQAQHQLREAQAAIKSEQAHEVQQLAHHQHRFQAARATREPPLYPSLTGEQEQQLDRGLWEEELRRAQAPPISVKPPPTDRAAAGSPDSDSLRIDDMLDVLDSFWSEGAVQGPDSPASGICSSP